MSKVSAQAEVEDILAAVRPNTCLVTIMLANNETGVIMVREPTVGREASAVPWMQLYSCGPALHVSQGPCPTAPTAHPLLSPHTPFPAVPSPCLPALGHSPMQEPPLVPTARARNQPAYRSSELQKDHEEASFYPSTLGRSAGRGEVPRGRGGTRSGLSDHRRAQGASG